MIDILELLQQQGIEVRQNSSNENEYTMCCMFCGDMGHGPDEKFRLGFNIESGLGHCFNCGWSSRKVLVEIARKLEVGGSELDEIRALPTTRETRTRPKVVELPEGTNFLTDIEWDDPWWEPALKYIRKRGITERQVREKEIAATVGCRDFRYRYRIIFPVKYEGELAGFVARDYTGRKDYRYLNAVGTKVLYNAQADLYPTRLAILSEGIVKALAIERATRHMLCSAATLGNSLSDIMSNQLRPFEEVVVFPDPDRPGMEGFLGVAANLVPVVKRVTMIWPWPHAQADDMAPNSIRELIRGRRLYTPALEMEIQQEMWRRA